MENTEHENKFSNFYNKNYKILLLIPVVVIVFSFVYLSVFYSSNGDFFNKDFSLTGGTAVTLIGKIDSQTLESAVSGKLNEVKTREIYDISTREQTALVVETKDDVEKTKSVLENYLGYKLDENNSSFEFIGSTLGESFYKQLITAILFAFLFMSLTVFIIFRNFVPSLAVIISAFADIIMTLAVVDILGIKISSGGIVAFLMLIGYSVDTDILLTNRLLKRSEGSINEKLLGAFKTGITMTLTSLLAIIFALVISTSFSGLLTQIFTVLAIGLGFDIMNTWITNASILKWHLEKNGK